jgi:pimeloyl-ACP methyl ester carboxylesterase
MPYLDRDGVRIFYDSTPRLDSADGPLPLLLSHGFGESSQMWQPNLATLSAGRQVITWDMRGHGRSDCPDDPAKYSQAACVADMAALLDAHEAPRAIVGGLSLGGYLSLAFWRAFPQSVAALVLCATGPGFRSDRARQDWNDRAAATADRVRSDSPGLALAALGMLAQHCGAVIDSLPSIGVPVLVLVGERDRAFLAAADYMAAKIPGAELVRLPDAGHVCNADQPDLFNGRVLAFLDQLAH